jgi:hypothetical protein
VACHPVHVFHHVVAMSAYLCQTLALGFPARGGVGLNQPWFFQGLLPADLSRPQLLEGQHRWKNAGPKARRRPDETENRPAKRSCIRDL